jgi:hypothetical protein
MKEEIINFIVQTIGFAIIFVAVDYKREVKIKAFTSEWWVVITILAIGGSLVKFNI